MTHSVAKLYCIALKASWTQMNWIKTNFKELNLTSNLRFLQTHAQFHQRSESSFYARRSQTHKKDNQSCHQYLLTLLGSTRAKAALVESWWDWHLTLKKHIEDYYFVIIFGHFLKHIAVVTVEKNWLEIKMQYH